METAVLVGSSFQKMCTLRVALTPFVNSVHDRWLRTEKAIREKQLAELAANPVPVSTEKPDGLYARNNGYCSGTLASSLAGSSNMVWRN